MFIEVRNMRIIVRVLDLGSVNEFKLLIVKYFENDVKERLWNYSLILMFIFFILLYFLFEC